MPRAASSSVPMLLREVSTFPRSIGSSSSILRMIPRYLETRHSLYTSFTSSACSRLASPRLTNGVHRNTSTESVVRRELARRAERSSLSSPASWAISNTSRRLASSSTSTSSRSRRWPTCRLRYATLEWPHSPFCPRLTSHLSQLRFAQLRTTPIPTPVGEAGGEELLPPQVGEGCLPFLSPGLRLPLTQTHF